EGLVSADQAIAAELRQSGRPIVMAINKIDDKRARGSSLEFYGFGFDSVIEVSAEHGTGVADLLDEIVARLGPRASGLGARSTEDPRDSNDERRTPSPERRDANPEPRDAPEITVAIVGRPNVGKS